MSIDWTSFGSAIVGAIVGGFVGGFFSLKATKESFRQQKLQALDNEKLLVKGVLQAIHDELESIYERYQETMGARLESLSDNAPLNYYYPLVSDFFTVYNGNTFFIGRIPDHDLRKRIIQTYTLAKGLVDSFRLNNDLVSKWDQASMLHQETKSEVHHQHMLVINASLIEYAKSLKKGHARLKTEVAVLLRELRKNGVLSQ